MKSYDYIAEVKQAKGLDTDYKVAKMLNWGQNKITQYKNGQTMDNEAARQIAEILDIPVWKVIADMEVQRAKDEPTRKAWAKLSKLRKEAGIALPNLLILNSFIGFVVHQFYILCKITHEQSFVVDDVIVHTGS